MAQEGCRESKGEGQNEPVRERGMERGVDGESKVRSRVFSPKEQFMLKTVGRKPQKSQDHRWKVVNAGPRRWCGPGSLCKAIAQSAATGCMHSCPRAVATSV